jgi:hypothetical protein
MISAMKTLIKNHSNCVIEDSKWKAAGDTCALCITCREIVKEDNDSDVNRCSICPWVRITGEDCMKDGGIMSRTSAQRITELVNWIELYREDALISEEYEFKPFEVSMTIHSIEEAAFMALICNVNSAGMQYKMAKLPYGDGSMDDELKLVANLESSQVKNDSIWSKCHGEVKEYLRVKGGN